MSNTKKYLVKEAHTEYYLGIGAGIQERLDEAASEGYPLLHQMLSLKDVDVKGHKIVLVMKKEGE